MTVAPAKRPVGRPRKAPVEPVHHAGVAEALALARSMAADTRGDPPPQGVRVTIRKPVRREEEPVEEEAVWPRGWPLPDAGTIVLGRDVGGWTSHVEMDLVNERIIVVLRAT